MRNSKGIRFLVCMAAFSVSVFTLTAFGGAEEKDAEGKGQTEPKYFRDRNQSAPRPEPRTRSEAELKALETARVTGRVRMVGSGVYTELVITGPAGEWHTESRDRGKLINLQQRIVTVEGKLDSLDMTLPNGKRRGTWLILRDITVISSE